MRAAPAAAGIRGRYARWCAQVAGTYGGKRPFLQHHKYLWLYRFGIYQRYVHIDWRPVRRVVFVCSGNVCRSPYCEARARSLGLEAASFGLLAEAKQPANATIRMLAQLRGLDLAQHSSKTLQQVAVSSNDLLVAMEPPQAAELQKLTAGACPQITLLGLWSSTLRPCLHDPYGLGQDYFAVCLNILDDGVQRIAKEVKHSHAG